MNDHVHTDPPLTLSFMGANYVGRELGYGAAAEWGPFDVATNAAFEPIETFGPASKRSSQQSSRPASKPWISGSRT